MLKAILQRCLLLCLLLASGYAVSAEPVVHIFKSGNYAEILQQHRNRPFMMVFWSLDCPPCYKELAMLSEEIRKQPQLELVIVSVDSSDDIKEIRQKLGQFGLDHVNAWVFDTAMAQQLRYEVDPNWYGELPRSYLFDSQHNRQAITGILRPAVLQTWASLSADIDID